MESSTSSAVNPRAAAAAEPSLALLENAPQRTSSPYPASTKTHAPNSARSSVGRLMRANALKSARVGGLAEGPSVGEPKSFAFSGASSGNAAPRTDRPRDAVVEDAMVPGCDSRAPDHRRSARSRAVDLSREPSTVTLRS